MSRLLVLREAYPELKANQNFLALQNQLEGTEKGRAAYPPELVKGIRGKAYSFDGKTDYIDIGKGPSLQTEIFTIAAWIKTSDRETAKRSSAMSRLSSIPEYNPTAIAPRSPSRFL